VAFLVALAIALVATPLAAYAATRLGVVDRPGPHKVQRVAVPYLGGVAVFIAMGLTIAPSRPRLLVPLALALALGVADDVRPLPPGVRLVCQLGIGLAAGWAAPAPTRLGFAVTAVVAIGMLNAVNLLDGLDGLAAGVALAAAVGFAILSDEARVPALALAGALAGFLVFNRPPARIYLGDGGAYLVGTSLALLAGIALDDRRSVAAWAAVPLLLAVPALDTAVAVVRRRRARAPLLSGDRGHVYDQLVDRGRSRVTVVAGLIATQGLLSLIAVGVVELSGGWAVAVSLACAAGLVSIVGVGGFVSSAGAGGAS
jgi:UDP-GlcNAc:undecaprenyl-phosphate/decaprenyl-phosphate GlcNAc-1-phosphate transferase